MSSSQRCLRTTLRRAPDVRYQRNITGLHLNGSVIRAASSATPQVKHHDSLSAWPTGAWARDIDRAPKTSSSRAGSLSKLSHSPESSSATTPVGSPDAFINNIRDQLSRARETMNLSSAESLWAQFTNLSETNQRCKMFTIRSIHEGFLLTFLQLRRAHMALNVWNSMIAYNCPPTVKTWSIMMKGCQWDRDHHQMEAMWRRMRSSGIRPDVRAWTTRIFCLFRLNRPAEGLHALDEMAIEWSRAEARRKTTSVTHEVPKPNVEIMNSAVSGLASQRSDSIGGILSWGKRFKIEPDITTYNVLINVSLRQNDSKEAYRILKVMRQRGIQPDSATYTILLNDMFMAEAFADQSHEQQTETVMSLVASLEADGTPIDDRGYALIMDRLVKQYDNMAAVQVVLAHLNATKRSFTPHMYTIIMTHYFQQPTLDLAAMDALWGTIASQSDASKKVDVILYDRMIEGYARHLEQGRMMTFLTRMSAEGKRPGWLAMAAVVKCLAHHGEYDRIKEIVSDARHGEGILWAGMRGIKGQHDFWNLVRQLGFDDLAMKS